MDNAISRQLRNLLQPIRVDLIAGPTLVIVVVRAGEKEQDRNLAHVERLGSLGPNRLAEPKLKSRSLAAALAVACVLPFSFSSKRLPNG